MIPHPPARRVAGDARFWDRSVAVVLWIGGAGVLSAMAVSLAWLGFHALFDAGIAVPGRIAGWMGGSIFLGMGGALLAFPLAIAGALWTDPVRTGPLVRLCSALPLSVPAFLVAMRFAPWLESLVGVPTRHPGWAVFALAWGGIAPQWLGFSRALALPGLGRWREAALALGIPERGILTGIALPAARRGILAGWMRSFARNCGETMVILLVAGGTIGGRWTAGEALVIELPKAELGGSLWLDLLRAALLLGTWTVLLQLGAALLDRSQSRAAVQ
ncbi:MAG TPA: ABC transporter permease subunit [Fibrobacteria bacterium]|nr:ABC transporter permease subunit [Fibrobacteria bacterium]